MLTLKMETCNAAFGENEAEAAAILLRDVANKLQHGGREGGPIMDENGNKVGEWLWTPQHDEDEDDETETTWDTDEVMRWFDNDEGLYQASREIVAHSNEANGAQQLEELWLSWADDDPDEQGVTVSEVDFFHIFAEIESEDE